VQFHLNGFRPGDPNVSEQARLSDGLRTSSPDLEEVDVLIVGCGPTGLTLAAQLAAFSGIMTRIVELKPGPLCPVQNIFAMRGIDRSQGALVVVRPDQYVAHVLPLDALDEITAFFTAFMLPAS
jgi:hypothetical protein